MTDAAMTWTWHETAGEQAADAVARCRGYVGARLEVPVMPTSERAGGVMPDVGTPAMGEK